VRAFKKFFLVVGEDVLEFNVVLEFVFFDAYDLEAW